MQITTILPVSRLNYLDRILDSLKNQTIQPQTLIVIFDGSDEDYLEVRNRVVGLPYQHVLCTKSTNDQPAYAISERRKHISNIHNQFREIIGFSDWIFSIEDDGVLPTNALERLLNVAQYHFDAGMITGVELGRWGVKYVGAWEVFEPSDPQVVTSLPNRAGEDLVEEIDACGLYCALIRNDVYRNHEFNSNNGLGPDVNLGLYARTLGFKNYIDWGVPITHLTATGGLEVEIPATDNAMIVKLVRMGTTGDVWSQTKYPSGQSAYGKL